MSINFDLHIRCCWLNVKLNWFIRVFRLGMLRREQNWAISFKMNHISVQVKNINIK